MYNRIDKVERDIRRLTAKKDKAAVTNVINTTGNNQSETLLGKPIKDTAVKDGDVLIYDKREKIWIAGPAGGGFSGDMDDIPDGAIYVKTENNYTDAEKTKLAGIAAGAEVNVNADWDSVAGDSQILNKPSIPVVSDIPYNATTWNANTDAPTKNAIRDKIELLDSAKLDKAGGFMNGGLVYMLTYIAADGPYNLGNAEHVLVLLTNGAVTADVTLNFDTGFDSDGRDYIICAVDIDATFDVVLSTAATIFELPDGTTTNTITLTDADNGKVFIFKALTTINGQVWKQIYPDAKLTNIISFTDELAQDAVGAMADTNTLSYLDPGPSLSVKRQMSVIADASGLKLDGDAASPGNNKVYGTDSGGVKGWKNDPTAALPEIVVTRQTITANTTIASGYSAYVYGPFEIPAGFSLEVAGAFEIG